jgi:hypothetical protein
VHVEEEIMWTPNDWHRAIKHMADAEAYNTYDNGNRVQRGLRYSGHRCVFYFEMDMSRIQPVAMKAAPLHINLAGIELTVVVS